MSVIIKIILLIAYITSPAVATFLLGYGGLERLVSIFYQVFILSLVVLLLYDGYLFARCFRAGIHKEVSTLLLRFIVITCMLLTFVFLAPVLSIPVRRYGAITRLNVLGGDSFCTQLLHDASELAANAGDEVSFFPYEQMPQSFRMVGGESARARGGIHAQVNIRTSGRPYGTGWILLPGASSEVIDDIKVADRIFRY